MPYQRIAAVILEEWRAVERAMNDPSMGPDALEILRAEAARLRNEYQRLIAESRQHRRPEPPPFPDR